MPISPDLLKKYLDNQCTPEERKKVEEYLALEKNATSDLPDELAEEMKANFWTNISSEIENKHTTRVIPLHKRIMRYAAVAVILFAIGFFTYRTASNKFFEDSVEVSVALKTITTQRGEKRTVTLPDGSTVRMNYETEIQAPEQFEGDERVVYLRGHAHFDVARDTERPFIIYTEDSKTEVLGTSFDINTKRKGETEIIVTSGTVAFSEKDENENHVILEVNDRAVLNADQRIALNKVDAARLTAWKDNRLVFDKQTLSEVIAILEPWYATEIKVERSELLTVDFKISLENPSLQLVMEELSFLGKFKYTLDENKVIIY
ncbi:MAG: FecR domain-containing protein [Bacteroidota bacterium]